MLKKKTPPVLRRYTDLPALLYLLEHKQLTLLDPKTWDDTNDSYYMVSYKEKKKLKSVLALCLTEAEETYHHWRIFSSGSAGVCICFDRVPFLDSLNSCDALSHRPVRYMRVRDAKRRTSELTVDELPFLKRAGFGNEEEYRILYESFLEERSYFDFPISLNHVSKITLSPWLNVRLSNTIKGMIHSIPDCSKLRIQRSTLIGNAEWKGIGDAAIQK